MNDNEKLVYAYLFTYFKPSCPIQSICPIVDSPDSFRPDGIHVVNPRSWATVLIKSKISSNFFVVHVNKDG